jgi:ABC-2 type transport system permease protein
MVRGFLRRTEFIGLYVRLVVIGAVVIALVDQWWLAALLAALFTYMIGFQLLPLYQVHDEIVFTYLYPLAVTQKPQAFKRLLGVLLLLAAGGLACGALISGHWLVAGSALVAGIIVAIAVAWWYLPTRLAKLAVR